MTRLFLTLAGRSLAAGVLILAVIAMRPLLTRLPRRVCLVLWALAAVRLCLPVTLTSALSLIPRAAAALPQAVLSGAVSPDASVSASGFSGQSGTSGSIFPQELLSVLACVWAFGAALLVLYALTGFLRTRRRLREAVCLGGNVWVCDRLDTAFVFGVLRPRICLPSDLDAAAARLVLAHERTHLRRGDPLWKLLGFLLLAVYWFHPLVWAAYLLFCRDLELACDERVIRKMSFSERKAYSRALLLCSAPRRAAIACPPAFGELCVKARIRAVLGYKRPAPLRCAAAALICLAAAVCFLTDPEAVSPAAGTQPGTGTATASYSGTSAALPAARLLTDCALRTAPDGSVLETALPLEAGARVAVLFSAETGPGRQLWYQVQYNGPQGEAIGWLPAGRLEIPAPAAF